MALQPKQGHCPKSRDVERILKLLLHTRSAYRCADPFCTRNGATFIASGGRRCPFSQTLCCSRAKVVLLGEERTGAETKERRTEGRIRNPAPVVGIFRRTRGLSSDELGKQNWGEAALAGEASSVLQQGTRNSGYGHQAHTREASKK